MSYVLLFCITLIATPILGFVGSTREMVIFSEYGRNETIDKTFDQDPSESMRPAGLGAASNLLLTALFQEVPVLVPAALWQSIVDHKQFFDALKGPSSDDELYAHYGRYKRFKDKTDFSALRAYIKHVQEAITLTQKALRNASSPDLLKRELEDIKNNLVKKGSLPHDAMTDFKWLEVTRFALCAFLPLDRYIVKEVSDKAPFYLFIPTTYLDTTKERKRDQDRRLGLKISNLATVLDPYGVKAVKMHYSQSMLQEVLETIFIKKHEVLPHEVQRWTLFIMGHGTFSQEAYETLKKVKNGIKKIDRKKKQLERKLHEPQNKATLQTLEKHRSRFIRKTRELEEANKIVGLPIESFQRLIQFFEKSLDMGLLFYSSCSAGQKHAIDAFDRDGKPMRLSFPVCIDTLLEAPAFIFPSELRLESCVDKTMPLQVDQLVDWKERRIILDAPYDFESFFKNAHSKSSALDPVANFVKSMTTFLKKTEGGAYMQPNDVNNVLSIRLAGNTHFSVIDAANLFSIAPREKLTLKADKQIIFFTHPEMDTVDVCKSKVCPFFCSLLPGKAMHTIKELYAPAYTLCGLIEHFFPVEELNVPKLIHVHNLRCKNEKNTLTCYENVYLFNMVPHPSEPKKHVPASGILFKHRENGFRALWPFDLPAPNPISLERHDALKIEENIKHLKAFFKDANTLQNVIPNDKCVLSLPELCKELNTKNSCIIT